MAASGPNYGTGASITFSSSFFAFITNIDWDGIERKSIDTSNNSLTAAMTAIPGKLYNPGTLTVELLLDNNADWTTPITASPATVTLTFPKFGAQTTAGTWAASGFMTSYKIGVPFEDRSTATATIQFSGAVTITQGS